MGLEIERKFLVTGRDWHTPRGVHYSQGYLNRDPARTVRVRLAGQRAYLTIKGTSVGASRAEFEYEVPFSDGEQLLGLCEGPLIEKVRHRVPHAGLLWEVDEFLGDNSGLVVAEVELSSEDQPFERPLWVAAEVTHDPRYFNSRLAVQPYCTWHDRVAALPESKD